MSKDIVLFYSIGVLVVIVAAASVFFFTRKRTFFPSFAGLLMFSIIFSLYLPIAQLFKYRSLHFYVDFAAWLEILKNVVTHGVPLSSVHAFIIGQPPPYHWFAVHFTPLIYLFALPFTLIPRAETLIVLNYLFLLSSIIPLYKLAVLMSGDKRFARFLGVCFLLYPTFHYITLYEFEMLRFSIPVLLWMLYFFERRQVAWYFVFVTTALLVREEVGLTIVMFGLYAWFLRKQRLLGIMTSIFGIGMFVLIAGVVMPTFHTVGSSEYLAAAGSLQQWGRTLPEIAVNLLTDPVRVVSTIFSLPKFANVFMLFVPLLFVSFLAPGALLGALPSIGIGLVSPWPLHISYMLYYVAPAVPFIFYAFIKAWPKVVRQLPSPSPQSPPIKGGEVKKDPSPSMGEVRRGWNETALMCAVLTGVLLSNIWFGPSPISLQFWFKDLRPAPFRTQDFHFSVYRVTDHHRKAQEFVDRIPGDVIVSAQEFFQPRLFNKKGAMVFPRLVSRDGTVQADYVLLDITHNNLPTTSPVRFEVTDEALTGVMDNPKTWELISTDGEFFLYKRL